jgi:hypothetical protein
MADIVEFRQWKMNSQCVAWSSSRCLRVIGVEFGASTLKIRASVMKTAKEV